MARYLMLVMMLLLVACRVERTPRPETQRREDVARAVIQETRTQLEQALVEGDADRLATLFTHTALYTRAGTVEIATPRLIRDDARAFFSDTAVTAVSFEAESVDVLSGGIAHEIGRYTQMLQPASDTVRAVQGQYIIRWRRGPEANWRIDRLLMTAR